MGGAVAAARIQEATRQGSWWVAQPGRIAYGVSGSASAVQFASLSSGTASLPVVENLSVNINPAQLIEGGGVVTADANAVLPVKWIYVREDGTQIIDPPTVPAYAAGSSKLVGRYAFWADDMSARLNLNAAASRPAAAPTPAPASHPSRLDLSALSTLTPDDIAALRTHRDNALFDTAQDAKGARDSATLRTALETHNGRDPIQSRPGSESFRGAEVGSHHQGGPCGRQAVF